MAFGAPAQHPATRVTRSSNPASCGITVACAERLAARHNATEGRARVSPARSARHGLAGP
jgi:hypothetical protein